MTQQDSYFTTPTVSSDLLTSVTRSCLSIVCAIALATTQARADAREQCRILAASPNEPDAGRDGQYDYTKINVSAAEPNCRAAAAASDATPADFYRLARVLRARHADQEGKQAYFKSAQLNYAPAQYILAYWYLNGLVVPKDPATGLAWLRKSVAQKDSAAQNLMANLYYSGDHVPRDFNLAFSYWRAAAAQGNPDAIKTLNAIGQNKPTTSAIPNKTSPLTPGETAAGLGLLLLLGVAASSGESSTSDSDGKNCRIERDWRTEHQAPDSGNGSCVYGEDKIGGYCYEWRRVCD